MAQALVQEKLAVLEKRVITVIPPENSVRMYEMTEGYRKIHLIPGASHANSVLTEPALYTKYVNSFLEDIGK